MALGKLVSGLTHCGLFGKTQVSGLSHCDLFGKTLVSSIILGRSVEKNKQVVNC